MAYKIVKGDTLSKIAKDKGVTLQALLAANPNIKDANKIRVGQSIKMPDTKKMPGAKGGPYGRVSQTEMNLMRSDGKAYTKGVRTKMKAGAETTGTPKKTKATKDAKSGRSAMLEKAEKLKLQKQGKLPVSKPKKKDTTPVSSKTGSSLSKEAMAKAKALKNKVTMAMPKPKPKTKTVASRTSRRKGRKA